MEKNRKGQLSVETMIIYGLIIMVALTVIGGLIYFKVLDIGAYLPDKCDLGGQSDLKCEEIKFSSSSGNLELGIRNVGQKPIAALGVRVADDAGLHFSGEKGASAVDTEGDPIDSTNTIAPGEIVMVSIPVGSGIQKSKVLRGPLYAQYKFKDGAIALESSGELRIRAS